MTRGAASRGSDALDLSCFSHYENFQSFHDDFSFTHYQTFTGDTGRTAADTGHHQAMPQCAPPGGLSQTTLVSQLPFLPRGTTWLCLRRASVHHRPVTEVLVTAPWQSFTAPRSHRTLTFCKEWSDRVIQRCMCPASASWLPLNRNRAVLATSLV